MWDTRSNSHGQPPPGRKGIYPKTMIASEHGCPHRRRPKNWYAKHGRCPSGPSSLAPITRCSACVAAGMGVALLPRSVLTTFPESKRLTVHRLPSGENRADTVLIWRKGASSPNIEALREILSELRQPDRVHRGRRAG
jgi:DNA-binding transcriptional LysR family regulator